MFAKRTSSPNSPRLAATQRAPEENSHRLKNLIVLSVDQLDRRPDLLSSTSDSGFSRRGQSDSLNSPGHWGVRSRVENTRTGEATGPHNVVVRVAEGILFQFEVRDSGASNSIRVI